MTADFVCFAVDVHDRLRIGVEYLNSIYGSSLTVIFSFYFYRVTSQLFGILDFFGGEGPKYLRPYMVFYQFLPTCWNVWILVMVSYNCQAVMEKVVLVDVVFGDGNLINESFFFS